MDQLTTRANQSKAEPYQQLLKDVMEKLMDIELTETVGYAKGDRLPNGECQANYRNGYRFRDLLTGLGKLAELKVPRDRQGLFRSNLIVQFERRTAHVDALLLSLYAKGMSERDIADVIEELYGSSLSPATVSNLVSEVSDARKAWQSRKLHARYTAVFVDALYVKLRRDGTVANEAIYILIGITDTGERDILGMYVGVSESATTWQGYLEDLKQRGVTDVMLVAADGLTGLSDAVAIVFPKADFQRCIVHLVRNTWPKVRASRRQELCDDLKRLYKRGQTKEQAKTVLDELAAKWHTSYPGLLDPWIACFEHWSAFLDYPEWLQPSIYTTNWLERLNKELRKVTKTKNSFPTPDSLANLMYLKLMDIERLWNKRKLHGFVQHSDELLQLWAKYDAKHALKGGGM